MIAQLMRPSSDQVHIKVDMNKEDMDNFVFCVATKKSALRLAKDMADLVSYYCFMNSDRRKSVSCSSLLASSQNFPDIPSYGICGRYLFLYFARRHLWFHIRWWFSLLFSRSCNNN